MPQEVRMPSLGQTTDELRIVTWLKGEGDTVTLGEPLLEVETDKATLEVESAATGTLLTILRNAGETVQAGSLIAYVGAEGEMAPAARADGAPAGGLSLDTARGHTSDGAREDVALARALATDKVLASPVARRLATMHGIEINRVRGSGPGGRIEKQDVLALIESSTSEPSELWTDTPVPRHRQVIAQRLTQSVQTIPRITLTVAVNMHKARALLLSVRSSGLSGLTYTHLILRAVAHALRDHPLVNRLWLADGPRFRHLARADVGLAVAGEDTLLIVTIPEPDRVSHHELVRLTDEAIRRGRVGTLSHTDTKPTAITVSNLGMHGVDSFQAIVDPAQTAILATGRVAERVVVIDGGIHVEHLMQMSLTIDHRVADGVAAARFLRAIAVELEGMEA